MSSASWWSFIIMSSFSNFHQCRVLFYRRLRILNQQLRERERQEKEGLDPKIQVESKLSIVNTFSVSVSSILSWLGLTGQVTLCLSVCHCLAWSLSDWIMVSFLYCIYNINHKLCRFLVHNYMYTFRAPINAQMPLTH